MIGIVDANHEESSPNATTLLINRLACSLVGQTQQIWLAPDSQAAAIYGQTEITEDFRCNFGFNAAFNEAFRAGELMFVGVGQDSELRLVELSRHRFYMATLFLPQLRSQPGQPHPLIMAYLQAAIGNQETGYWQGYKHE